MSTALEGLSGHLEHHLAAALGSPGSPKVGWWLPQRHFLLLISTASGGFAGHLEHHLAAALGSPGRPKQGVVLLPQRHLLLVISTAARGLSGHLEHHLAAALGSPGSPKEGMLLPQWHFLVLVFTSLGRVSKLLRYLRSLDLVGARHVGHRPLQLHAPGDSHEQPKTDFMQGEQNTCPQGAAINCLSSPAVDERSGQREHSPCQNSDEPLLLRFLVDWASILRSGWSRNICINMASTSLPPVYIREAAASGVQGGRCCRGNGRRPRWR